MPHNETKTERALGLYGAGVPIEEIETTTGVARATIYSEACRRGIKRPREILRVALIEFTPTEEAAREALAFWRGVCPRHARYWRGELRRLRGKPTTNHTEPLEP